MGVDLDIHQGWGFVLLRQAFDALGIDVDLLYEDKTLYVVEQERFGKDANPLLQSVIFIARDHDVKSLAGRKVGGTPFEYLHTGVYRLSPEEIYGGARMQFAVSLDYVCKGDDRDCDDPKLAELKAALRKTLADAAVDRLAKDAFYGEWLVSKFG